MGGEGWIKPKSFLSLCRSLAGSAGCELKWRKGIVDAAGASSSGSVEADARADGGRRGKRGLRGWRNAYQAEIAVDCRRSWVKVLVTVKNVCKGELCRFLRITYSSFFLYLEKLGQTIPQVQVYKSFPDLIPLLLLMHKVGWRG